MISEDTFMSDWIDVGNANNHEDPDKKGCIIGLITFAILAVIVFVLFFVIVF